MDEPEGSNRREQLDQQNRRQEVNIDLDTIINNAITRYVREYPPKRG